MNPILSDPAYIRLKKQLIGSTGMAFYADRDDLLTELIGARLSVLGLRDSSAYASALADGEAGRVETDVLTAQLSIGETYFFRDEAQFAAIRDVILPDILARNKASRRLRIWSAGCATGAEPYSLAILLSRQLAGQIAGWQIEICATDLNRGYLATAAEGTFRPWALRGVSDKLKRECFLKTGQTWTILPRYKQWISFYHMNLADPAFSPPLSMGTHFDLILCRNVMIYFGPKLIHRLVAQFHRSLWIGGWLVVGAAEHNPQYYKNFRLVDAGGTQCYQKMSGQAPAEVLPAPATLLAPVVKPTVRLAAPICQPPRSLEVPGPAGMERLRQLADAGDWEAAAHYGRSLLTQDRLNAAIHFYQALIFENLGSAGDLERSLRQAIYLDRNFALAHYHLGLALKRARKTGAAARSFENVLKTLADLPDCMAVKAGPGITVTDLKELAKMHLERPCAV